MIPECTFILRNGQKCRAAATRNHPCCRHHGPKVDGPPVQRRHINPANTRWRAIGRNLRWIHPAEIPFAVHHILASMLLPRPDRLSDLVAGRYLRLLLLRLGTMPFDLSGAAPTPPASVPQPAACPIPDTPPIPGLPPEVRAAMHAFCEETTDENVDKLLAAFEEHGFITPEMLAEIPGFAPPPARPAPQPIGS